MKQKFYVKDSSTVYGLTETDAVIQWCGFRELTFASEHSVCMVLVAFWSSLICRTQKLVRRNTCHYSASIRDFSPSGVWGPCASETEPVRNQKLERAWFSDTRKQWSWLLQEIPSRFVNVIDGKKYPVSLVSEHIIHPYNVPLVSNQEYRDRIFRQITRTFKKGVNELPTVLDSHCMNADLINQSKM